MINLDDLKWKLNRIKREAGMIGGSLNILPIEQKNNHLEAAISLKNYKIELKVNPDLDEILLNDPDIKEYIDSKNITDPVNEICKQIMMHEIWHWKRNYLTGQIGCPTDIVNLNKLIENIYFTLEDEKVFEGMSENKKQTVSNDVSNLFEDLLVNTNLDYEGKSSCLPLIYYDQAQENGEYGLVGEGFLKLQMQVWGGEKEKKLLSKFYSDQYSKKTDEFVKKTLEDMGIKNLNKKETIKIFRNMDEWEQLSQGFAKNIADLLKEEKKESKKEGNKSQNQEGKGDKNSDSSDSNEGDSDGNELPSIVKSLDREIDKEAEKTIVLAAYNGKEAGKAQPPKLIKQSRILSIMYEHMSEKIPIKASTQKEGYDMPLSPLSFENFDPQEHRIEDIDFSKIIADMESPFEKELNFQTPSHNYTIFAPYKKIKERLPDIMFLFDCSGSMSDGYGEHVFDANWGMESKYHYALLGAFGALKWLKSERIAPYLKYNVTLFSNRTRTSGWKGYHEMEKAIEKFWEPEFGGTEIDMEVLTPELNVPPSVIIFITDGQIFEWSSIKDDFRMKTKKHMISYIEIKDRTNTGKDLKEWGCPVYHISKKEDLQGLIIDLTKQSFKKYKKVL